jgi:ribosomal protein S3
MYINNRAVQQKIKAWKTESGLGRIRKLQFKIDNKNHIVNVYCSRPGYLIGRGGNLINKYKNLMKVLGVKDIKLYEVEDYLI